ncbi:hypothetical protein Nmel_017705, partial [Mimus melanotis]
MCTGRTPPHNGTDCVWVGCGTPEEPGEGLGRWAQGSWGQLCPPKLCPLPALKAHTEEPPRSHSKEPVTHPT